MYLYIRIYIKDTLLHYIHFIFSYRTSQCYDLPVQIRKTYRITVNQINLSNTASCKGLCRISAYSSNAENRHTALRQSVHCRFPEKKLCSRKLICHNSFTPLIFRNLLL